MRSVQAQNLFAVLINVDTVDISRTFDEVSWITDRISLVLFPLLQVFAVGYSVIHAPHLLLMFFHGSLLVFVPLDFVGKEFFLLFISTILVVDGRFVFLIVKIRVKVVDMRLRIGVQFYLFVPK